MSALPPPPPPETPSNTSFSFSTNISSTHQIKRRKYQSYTNSIKNTDKNINAKVNVNVNAEAPKGRRSSLSNRGLRLLDSEHLAAPHSSIPTYEFYRHISPDLSDVKRMKLLILFSGAKVIEQQKKSKQPIIFHPSLSPKAKEIFTQLLKQKEIEVLRAVLKDKVNLSWISNPHKAFVPPRIPNPSNVQKEQSLKALKHELEILKREDDQWREVFSKRIKEHAYRTDQLRSGKLTVDQEVLEAVFKEAEEKYFSPLPVVLPFLEDDITNKIEQAKTKLFEMTLVKAKLLAAVKAQRHQEYRFVKSEFRVVPEDASLPLVTALAQMNIEPNEQDS